MTTNDMYLEKMLNPLADSLAMDFEVGLGQVTGSVSSAMEIMMGFPTPVTCTITDSLMDDSTGIAALLLHMSGDLYMIACRDKDEVIIYILDGGKLDLKNTKVLPVTFWSRKKLYHRIVPALKASFYRGFNDEDWVPFMDKYQMEYYLELREKGVASTTAVKEAVIA